MGGGQRNTQTAANQHHDNMWCAQTLGKKLRVAGECNAGFIDNALLHGGGNHCVKNAVATAIGGDLHGAYYVGTVCRIESTRSDGCGERHMPYQHPDIASSGFFAARKILGPEGGLQLTCPGLEQPAVGDENEASRNPLARERHAQIRPDAGGLTGSDRDQGQG